MTNNKITIETTGAINSKDAPCIAFAQCGDVEIGVFVGGIAEFILIGVQIEDDLPVEIFRYDFLDDLTALKAFAQAVTNEYAGA